MGLTQIPLTACRNRFAPAGRNTATNNRPQSTGDTTGEDRAEEHRPAAERHGGSAGQRPSAAHPPSAPWFNRKGKVGDKKRLKTKSGQLHADRPSTSLRTKPNTRTAATPNAPAAEADSETTTARAGAHQGRRSRSPAIVTLCGHSCTSCRPERASAKCSSASRRLA